MAKLLIIRAKRRHCFVYGRKMSRSPRLYFTQSHYSSANNVDDDKFIHGGSNNKHKTKKKSSNA